MYIGGITLLTLAFTLQMPEGWDDVRVVITRPPLDPDGPCSNVRPEDDNPGATLSSCK